jgi:hypothetical protein
MELTDTPDKAFAELFELFSKPTKSPAKAYRTYELTFENGEPIFKLSEVSRIMEKAFERNIWLKRDRITHINYRIAPRKDPTSTPASSSLRRCDDLRFEALLEGRSPRPWARRTRSPAIAPFLSHEFRLIFGMGTRCAVF